MWFKIEENELPPIRECIFCELPVPLENDPEDSYCNEACVDVYVSDAIAKMEGKHLRVVK